MVDAVARPDVGHGGALVSYLIAGVQPDQPPPPPMISGPILAVLAAAILLVSAPRFFRSASERG
jgi:hypothetical protein